MKKNVEITENQQIEQSAENEAPSKAKIRMKHSIKTDIPFYIVLIPSALLTILFRYLPMFGILIAFKDFNALDGIFGSSWAKMGGFENFVVIFTTPNFLDAIWNTLYINVLNLLITIPAPIILALLINECSFKPFKKVVQTISYLPHFLSTAAVIAIVSGLFDQYGLLNSILYKLGLSEQHLLENPNAFVPTLLITQLWQSIGWNSIIYLAAISSVNTDLYEAADLDGASRFQQAIHVTLPALIPTAVMLTILGLGSIFGASFDLMYGLQNPIAWKKENIATAIWKYGIGEGKYGVSTALGLMQGVIAFALTYVANKISDKIVGISMW